MSAPGNHRKVLHELRADVLHQRQLADRHHIVRGDADPCAGALAARLQAGLSGKADDGPVGERAAEAGVEGAAETVAVGQEHDHGDDAPRDAEHREGGSEPVVIEPVAGFAHDLAQKRERRPPRRQSHRRHCHDAREFHATSRNEAPRPAAAPPPAARDTTM